MSISTLFFCCPVIFPFIFYFIIIIFASFLSVCFASSLYSSVGTLFDLFLGYVFLLVLILTVWFHFRVLLFVWFFSCFFLYLTLFLSLLGVCVFPYLCFCLFDFVFTICWGFVCLLFLFFASIYFLFYFFNISVSMLISVALSSFTGFLK